MRIVSLLPSLTELVCALGRGGDLVGVTHECDFPPGVEKLPHLTRSQIPAAATSAEIDQQVTDHAGSLYDLDDDLLASLRPDLILTQEQCDVCAVNEATVRRAASSLPGRPAVESVNPTTLGEVFAMFRRVAALLDAVELAEVLLDRFDKTTREIDHRRSVAATPPRRVLVLEWLDPPFSSGHWNPEIVERAGGIESLGRSGQESRRATWDEIAASRPDLIIVGPCGFTLDRTVAELAALEDRPEWRDLAAVRNGSVVVVDGSAYFSRPGPRLETSLRIAAAAIHPELCLDLAPPEGQGWRFWPATTPGTA
jgi:iron complex transport system substrate-binding protein